MNRENEENERQSFIPNGLSSSFEKAWSLGSGVGSKKASKESLKKGLPFKASVFGAFFLLLLLSLGIGETFTVIPPGNLLYSQEEIFGREEEIKKALTKPYEDAKRKAEPVLYEYLRETYPEVPLSLSDVENGWEEKTSQYSISVTPTYDHPVGMDIRVRFTPDLETCLQNVCAYLNAVNGVIAQFGENTQKEISKISSDSFRVSTFPGKIYEEETENGEKRIRTSEEFRKFYEENSTVETNLLHPDFLDTLTPFIPEFFFPDPSHARWDFEGANLEYRGLVESDFVVCETGSKGETAEERCHHLTKESYVYTDVITISMYYNLSSYREEEVNGCIENAKNLPELSYVPLSGEDLVYEAMEDFYHSYITAFYGNLDFQSEHFSYTVTGEKHPREKIFEKLLRDGSLLYVPIWGFDPDSLITAPILEGIDPSGLGSLPDSEIWDRLLKLMENGTLSSSVEKIGQCTGYVQLLLYEKAGIAGIWHGNGKDYADVLAKASDRFVLENIPKAGGIFSTHSGLYGHTGYISEVKVQDGETYVTVEEANYYGKGKVTKTTMSAAELFQRSHGKISFANPV